MMQKIMTIYLYLSHIQYVCSHVLFLLSQWLYKKKRSESDSGSTHIMMILNRKFLLFFSFSIIYERLLKKKPYELKRYNIPCGLIIVIAIDIICE